MGLIDSPRLTPQDRDAWHRLARYDDALAHTARMDKVEMLAQHTIRDFAAAGACYVSTSWGKDSTVLAHLASECGVRLPLIYVRVRHWANPDCDLVRDAFLDRWDCDYHEVEVEATALRWWDQGADEAEGRTLGGGFREAERRYGDRHISGVRGEESKLRDMVMARWGEAGPHACRPIGRWSALDVFAYLARHDLPVHPAYAMSYGGTLDRRWLRVASIGGIRGADRQRATWEAHYYPDIVPAVGGGKA